MRFPEYQLVGCAFGGAALGGAFAGYAGAGIGALIGIIVACLAVRLQGNKE